MINQYLSVSLIKSSRQLQRGISLIELMIGLMIGLMIVLAAISILTFTSGSQRTISDSTNLQQQGSVVMQMIGAQVRAAGGTDLTVPNADAAVFRSANAGYGGSGARISGLDGGGLPDTLMVSVQDYLDASGNESLRDCLGNSPAAALKGVRIDSKFYVDTISKSLMCLGANTATTAQAIASGVEDFQVTYGVVTNADKDTQQIQYYKADAVTDWNAVRSVNVCLQMSTSVANNVKVGSVVGCGDTTIVADGLLRKVFRNSYIVRNL